MTKRLYEYDATVADLEIPPAVRRELGRRRLVASRGEGPRMVGPITPGVEICGLTNGQFSMVDLVEHVLEQIGPAHLACSTWTTGLYDQEQAAAFYRNGRILSARWILDPVIFGRRPESAGTLVRAFGIENFRAVNTHAKFAVLTNFRGAGGPGGGRGARPARQVGRRGGRAAGAAGCRRPGPVAGVGYVSDARP